MRPSPIAEGRAGLVALAGIAGLGVALACDPGWSVEGTVAVARDVDPGVYSRLVLRAESFDGGVPFRVDEEILDVVAGVPQRGGAAAPFPVSFAHGRLGVLPVPALRVSAFLSATPDSTAPAPEAADSQDVPLPSCGPYFTGYCGSVEGVRLVLLPVP